MTKYYYFTCLSCGKTNYSIDKNSLVECCNCNEKHNGEISIYICPNKGFKADFKTATSKVVKPKKSYSNEIEYIGNGVTEMSFSFNNMLELVSNKDDELLVLNKGPFFTCKKCGYSIIDQDFKKERKLKIEENGHSNGFEPCGNKHLDEIALGYTFKTDVVKFVFKSHYSFDAACSFLYALLDGISSTFLIERNDINGVLSREKNDTYSVIIYDDLPGGAGHVQKLLNENSLRKVLLETLAKVESCKCDIHTSCYNCLRNYKNQRRHKHLSRKGAIKVIKETLG